MIRQMLLLVLIMAFALSCNEEGSKASAGSESLDLGVFNFTIDEYHTEPTNIVTDHLLTYSLEKGLLVHKLVFNNNSSDDLLFSPILKNNLDSAFFSSVNSFVVPSKEVVVFDSYFSSIQKKQLLDTLTAFGIVICFSPEDCSTEVEVRLKVQKSEFRMSSNQIFSRLIYTLLVVLFFIIIVLLFKYLFLGKAINYHRFFADPKKFVRQYLELEKSLAKLSEENITEKSEKKKLAEELIRANKKEKIVTQKIAEKEVKVMSLNSELGKFKSEFQEISNRITGLLELRRIDSIDLDKIKTKLRILFPYIRDFGGISDLSTSLDGLVEMKNIEKFRRLKQLVGKSKIDEALDEILNDQIGTDRAHRNTAINIQGSHNRLLNQPGLSSEKKNLEFEKISNRLVQLIDSIEKWNQEKILDK